MARTRLPEPPEAPVRTSSGGKLKEGLVRRSTAKAVVTMKLSFRDPLRLRRKVHIKGTEGFESPSFRILAEGVQVGDLADEAFDQWWKEIATGRPRLSQQIEARPVSWEDYEIVENDVLRVPRTAPRVTTRRQHTHDTLRSGSAVALVLIAATQLIYFITGVVILNPLAAMSYSMKAECENVRQRLGT
jgi:hypothetical protein